MIARAFLSIGVRGLIVLAVPALGIEPAAAESFIGAVTEEIAGCPAIEIEPRTPLLVPQLVGFVPGEIVHASGTLEFGSEVCPPWNGGALIDATVRPAFQECGSLVYGPQGCTWFVPDGDETWYLLENLGRFAGGDHVRVEGGVDAEGIECFPVIGPVIRENTIESCPRSADLDGDGTVDFDDLLLLLAAWGFCSPFAPCDADLDQDGEVGFSDLLILLTA